MRTLALRLAPGSDLRASLERLAREDDLPAAVVVGAVGSLAVAVLRFAGRDKAARLEEDLELITLSGTIGREGCHLHAAVAGADGRVHGGHVMPGCIVRTTVELVLGMPESVAFLRRHDAQTGYRELVVAPLTPSNKEHP